MSMCPHPRPRAHACAAHDARSYYPQKLVKLAKRDILGWPCHNGFVDGDRPTTPTPATSDLWQACGWLPLT